MNRRNFLGAMLAACAAPAVVRAGSLMRINPAIVVPDVTVVLQQYSTLFGFADKTDDLYAAAEQACGERVQLIRDMVQRRAIIIEGDDRWLKLK